MYVSNVYELQDKLLSAAAGTHVSSQVPLQLRVRDEETFPPGTDLAAALSELEQLSVQAADAEPVDIAVRTFGKSATKQTTMLYHSMLHLCDSFKLATQGGAVAGCTIQLFDNAALRPAGRLLFNAVPFAGAHCYHLHMQRSECFVCHAASQAAKAA